MIPQEHQLKCETCGAVIDMRDLGRVLSHGNMSNFTGKYECTPVDVGYGSSKKVGDNVEWTKDKKPLNLNLSLLPHFGEGDFTYGIASEEETNSFYDYINSKQK
jgi:hypothetical protein